jgi:glucosamine--fructose-6-phosphate aminotransferase (isomerizing)
MCGIVGYLGEADPKNIILEGLRKMEYRGYDSAGVAILHNGVFKRVRACGKLSALEKKLEFEEFNGHLGIGHTRWATHGRPTERNAHPHTVDGISLVHNGIIENYVAIREELLREGAQINSDTDSELVAHLVSRELKQTKDLYKAVQNVRPRLHGAYSILVISENEPDRMVAFKNGPPLILGIAEHAILVASDVQALVAQTQHVIYLDDGEIAAIKGHQYQIFDEHGDLLRKQVTVVDWSPEQAEKQGYKHFMLKEIYEQPRAVAAAIDRHIDLETMTVRLRGVGFGTRSVHDLAKIENSTEDELRTLTELARIERVFFVACGTSFYASMVGEYLIERLARVPVECDIASEFRYRQPVLPKNSLVIVVSQSGETADTLAAIRQANSLGALTMSICNVKHSSIDREAQGHLYMNSGTEVGVASTKAFSSTLALMNVLALAIAKAKKTLLPTDERRYLESLVAVPSQMEAVLAYDKYFAEAAQTLKNYRGFLYMGRGVSYPIAMEGALKMKELAYMHAEGYAAGEMKHGPLALIDESMAIVMVAPHDDLYEKTVSNLEEARARGGQIISVGTGENSRLQELSEHYLGLPEGQWTINPLLAVIPLQLLAYHVADALGHDVDQPRNLAKSVTVE